MYLTLILGMGRSGKAAAAYLERQGRQVIGYDDQAADRSIAWERVEQVVISPGFPPTHAVVQEAQRRGLEIIGEMELAARALRGKAVAITGTNGKTTTTQLIDQMLRACGIASCALGNIGEPLVAHVEQLRDQVAVVEVSSYQLDTLKSRPFQVGVLLNITPDHLDRYPSFEAYARAKCHLARCIQPPGVLWVESETARRYRDWLGGCRLRTFGESVSADLFLDDRRIVLDGVVETILPLEYKRLRGCDLLNFLAAYGVSRELGGAPERLVEAFQTFRKPPHRLEWVGEWRDVAYYDDSKATNIDAVVQAVRALDRPLWLISGGVDKGAPYASWVEPFRGKVQRVFAIGESAAMIQRDLEPAVPVEIVGRLERAVERAMEEAQPGSAVVLAPGGASFDQFRDYAHRGERFQQLVRTSAAGQMTCKGPL
jgi:UDP-N-acetylmuramoylalanine--D-glutamate ligase